MKNAFYDSIGKSYAQTRKADLRISKKIQELLALPEGSSIADIGAGTGNYSLELAKKGYHLMAIEPSVQMRLQAMPHKNVTWIDGSAEKIPLKDDVVDGAVIVLAFHHFLDQKESIQEICRLVGSGPIVIFSWDVEKLSHFWLSDYFSGIYPGPKDVAGDVEAAAKNIKNWTGRRCEISEFRLSNIFSVKLKREE